MRIVDQSHAWMTRPDRDTALALLEAAGRTCWKSEERIGPGTAGPFVQAVCRRGHESVLEHVTATARFITDRSVTHELVRHRIGWAYSQESQRYVRQTDGVTFVRPVFWAEGSDMLERWRRAMQSAEDWYMHLLSEGATPQEARTVLPNSAKTEIVVTGNLRAWRHMLGLRTAKDAHPQIRALMTGVQLDLQEWLPEVFSG